MVFRFSIKFENRLDSEHYSRNLEISSSFFARSGRSHKRKMRIHRVGWEEQHVADDKCTCIIHIHPSHAVNLGNVCCLMWFRLILRRRWIMEPYSHEILDFWQEKVHAKKRIQRWWNIRRGIRRHSCCCFELNAAYGDQRCRMTLFFHRLPCYTYSTRLCLLRRSSLYRRETRHQQRW